MQRIIIVIFAYLALLSSTNLSAQGLGWESSLSEAFAKSASQNRPLLVFIEQKHCRWCKKMRSQTLADSGISKRLEKFVLVEVDKNGEEMKSLPATRFAPTIYLYSPKKELLIRVGGYFVVEDFDSYLDDFYKKLN